MPGFDNGVSSPGAASYMAPLLNFSQFGNWANDFQQGALNTQQRGLNDQRSVQNDQQQQLNDQQIAQGQRQAELAKTFSGGLPKDANGNIDYAKAAQMLAQKGDVSGAMTMLQQAAPPQSPMLTGGGQPQPQAQPQGQGGPQPASVPAKPLPAPAAAKPQGDPGAGTIADIVTDRLPQQDAATGETIGKIAKIMGVEPNAVLTPGQMRRAQGLLQRYAPEASTSSDGASSNLPPSANAVMPAPKPGQPAAPQGSPASAAGVRPPVPAGQGQPQGGPAQPQPQAAPPAAPAPQAQPQQPQQPQGGPITPQVPLPKGFNDPQQAILALRAEAARLSANPRAKGQVDALNDWASRIDASIQPKEVHQGTTLLDPKNGQPIYQGNQPGMDPAAINAAAERYLETGQLPPNMGRGAQGSATSNAIQNQAADLAAQRGIDMATLPGKWQQFKSQQVAIQRFTSGPQGNTIRSFNVLVDHLDTLKQAGDALKNGNNRFFNQVVQEYARQTGSPVPTNFDGVKALVGDEIVKAVVGGAGALGDREEVKKDIDKASSPQQLSELLERYQKLALGQLRGLRKQYEVATQQKNFGDFLLPGTLAALGGNKGEGKTDEDGWTKLPNGARIREIKPGEGG